MAFTDQNKSDAYLFFVLAFNAAPGDTYGGQIVEAYESGLTTQQIVNIYSTKEQFTNLYPNSQTPTEFATALVNNVASASTLPAVKAKAVADIELALAAGLTKGDVVFNVLGNLSKLGVTDKDWGATVAQINNKVAVAKVLTEGDKALVTTDVALLQGPLSGVTEDVATVQTAINGAGSLLAKLESLAGANKAKGDFAATLDLDGNGKADGLKADTAQAAVTTDVGLKAAAVNSKITGYTIASTEAQKAALVAVAKADNDAAVTAAQTAVVTKTQAATDLGVTAAQISQYKTLAANVAATTKADTAAVAAQAGKLAELNALTAGTSAVAPDGSVTNYIVADAVTGKLSLATATGTLVTEANKAVVTALMDSIVAAQATAVNKAAAATAQTQFEAALDAVNTTGVSGAEKAAIDAIIAAEGVVVTAQKANPDLDKLVAAYAASKANDTKLVALDKAITDAGKAFTDAGLPMPKEVAAGLVATAGDDAFIIGTVKTGAILGFGVLGKDAIYVGKGYELNATGDLAKGDAAKLEVFFKAEGANTDVYVEQKAFDSNVTGASDIVKITLTGVAADKLVFNDGFITVTA